MLVAFFFVYGVGYWPQANTPPVWAAAILRIRRRGSVAISYATDRRTRLAAHFFHGL